MTAPVLRCGDRTFVPGARTLVMGIVNVTPDSFSDGGEHLDPAHAYDHAMRLLDEGADILDLGAESTRPGAEPVGADDEAARLFPVVERLVAAGVRCLSIDTYKSSIARGALERGAAWINDVSGLADPELAGVAAGGDALVVMHARAMTAGRVDDRVEYADVVSDVSDRLTRLMDRAVDAGVDRSSIVVDPGIGFGKTVGDNLDLLARLGEIRPVGQPVLVGPSRKRFLTAVARAETLADRDAATLGACCAAAMAGADIVRVHRVEGVRAALAVIDAIRERRAIP